MTEVKEREIHTTEVEEVQPKRGAKKPGIMEVRENIDNFVRDKLEKEGLPITIVEVRKVDEAPVAWAARVEIVETNEFIKAMDLGTTVYDRNIYELTMDEDMEVLSFNRTEPFAIPKSTEDEY